MLHHHKKVRAAFHGCATWGILKCVVVVVVANM